MLEKLPIDIISDISKYLNHDISLCKTISLVSKSWKIISRNIFKSYDHNIALMWACENGKYESVKYLLTFPDIDLSLHAICFTKVFQNRFMDFYKTLRKSTIFNKVENLCMVKEANEKYNDYIKILSLLLKDGRVDPSHKRDFMTPLDRLLYDGHLEMAKELLKDNRAIVPESSSYSLRNACYNGDLDLIKTLMLDSRVDPSEFDNESLITACSSGYLEVVKELLKDNRVNPAARNGGCIIAACKGRHWKIVEELLKDERVDPTVNDNRALSIACSSSTPDLLKILLNDTRIDPSKKCIGDYPIIIACDRGKIDNVMLLLNDKRVDPSVDDNMALKTSLRSNFFSGIAKELLKDSRVDPSSRNNYAIREACKKGFIDIVKELLKDSRVDPTVKNNRVIQYALSNENVELLEELMKDMRIMNKKLDLKYIYSDYEKKI